MTIHGTGSDLPQVYRNFMGERQLLVDAIARDHRGGTSATAIAHQVRGAFGRDVVAEFCAEIRLYDSARKALAESGLKAQVSVSHPGIDAPREVRLHLAADPSEIGQDRFSELPGRLVTALRDYHIALAPAHDTAEGTDLEAALLDGEEVRLVKAKPRT